MSGRDLSLFFNDWPMYSQDPFNALLPFATGSTRPSARGALTREMALDVKETDKAIEVQADIPGVKKEDISLDVQQDVLTLGVDSKTEEKKEGEEQGVKWHHTERSRTFMKRSLRMPENADMDNVSASYENGTLKVSVPKKEVAPKNKKITVN